MNNHILREITYDIFRLGLQKIAIIGSRDYPCDAHIRGLVDWIHEKIQKAEIVSGGAMGVDSIAEQAAKDFGLATKIFLPKKRYLNSGQLDKRVYLERNEEIAKYADCMIGFYSGKNYRNSGTLNAVEHCANLNKPFWIVTP